MKRPNFYDQNAQEFFNATINVDMYSLYDQFLPLLKPGSLILDAGCGSGRDSLHFKKQGFKVEAFDSSAELVKLASEHTGLAVKHMSFSELTDQSKFDAIWACASILHLNKEQLKIVFRTFHDALKANGIFYTSFKYGSFEGTKNGRHFTNFAEERFTAFNDELNLFRINKMWVTADVRPEKQDEQWLNIILKKI